MDATAFSSYPMSYPSYPTYGYPQAMPMAMPMAMPEGATREVATAPTPVYEAPQMTMPTMTTMPVMPSFYTNVAPGGEAMPRGFMSVLDYETSAVKPTLTETGQATRSLGFMPLTMPYSYGQPESMPIDMSGYATGAFPATTYPATTYPAGSMMTPV